MPDTHQSIRCTRHKNYKALREPKVDCEPCRELRLQARAYRMEVEGYSLKYIAESLCITKYRLSQIRKSPYFVLRGNI